MTVIKEIKINLRLVILYVLITAGLNTYLLSKYRIGDLEAKAVSFSSDFNRYDLLIYTTESHGFGVNFSNPIHPTPVNDEFVFDLGGKMIRNFRIDLGDSTNAGYLKNLTVHYGSYNETLKLSELKRSEVYLKDDSGNFSNKINGYLELKHNRISVFELLMAEVLILILGIALCGLSMNLYRSYLASYMGKKYITSLLLILFIFSVFLPQPLFNVFFILSFAFIVKDFDYRRFFNHKTGLIFLAYFFWFLINNVWISKAFNFKLLETLLPFFFLPFYVACLPGGNFLRFFPLSAFVLSLYFISSSMVDFSICHNLNYFSFDAFTKYVHPVYFSYLLLFSLMYIELDESKVFNRGLFIPVLSIALLCCGSKLIISLTALFYVWRLFRKKRYLGYAFMAVALCVVFLFPPTRKRFQEIINVNSFSILKENPILSRHDPRLTGLTLRLIIWQESLKTFTDVKDVIFGQGSDRSADSLLEQKLLSRNVEVGHTKYDPHNQFITTFYKMGLVGLFILLAVCVYCLKIAVQKNKILLLCTILLFIIAMFTESVLQRVTGIFFFITVLLLQTILIANPSYFENSNPGDQGNSQ